MVIHWGRNCGGCGRGIESGRPEEKFCRQCLAGGGRHKGTTKGRAMATKCGDCGSRNVEREGHYAWCGARRKAKKKK